MIHAVKDGDLSRVIQILDSCFSAEERLTKVTMRRKKGRATVLQMAAHRGDVKMACVLLANSASAWSCDTDGCSAVKEAVGMNRVQMCRLLLGFNQGAYCRKQTLKTAWRHRRRGVLCAFAERGLYDGIEKAAARTCSDETVFAVCHASPRLYLSTLLSLPFRFFAPLLDLVVDEKPRFHTDMRAFLLRLQRRIYVRDLTKNVCLQLNGVSDLALLVRAYCCVTVR